MFLRLLEIYGYASKSLALISLYDCAPLESGLLETGTPGPALSPITDPGDDSVVWIRQDNRDKLGIIFLFAPYKHTLYTIIRTVSLRGHNLCFAEMVLMRRF